MGANFNKYEYEGKFFSPVPLLLGILMVPIEASWWNIL